MPVLRKRAHSNGRAINGLFVHSSPPRVLQLSSAHVKQLIRSGDIDKLEQAVLEGQGKKLVGEYSADYKTRTFLKSIPTLMSKISLLHDAVNSGRLEELKWLLEEEPPDKKKKLVLAKDDSGVGLLHKAVYYDLGDIYRWLVDKFPHIVSLRDAEGRTAYHYTPLCRDPQNVQKLLTNAGADPSSLDMYQHSAKYYMDHRQELELPSGEKVPPKVKKVSASKDGLNFKKSNIRIWIHQRNLANLQQVVWEGHGSKLLVEHSNNPKIKKFLEAVPHIMGLIKEIHTDVQNGDLNALKTHLSPPVPQMVLSGKDANGLTPLHKAVGLGKEDIAEYIVNEYPSCINATDNDGRTPLHYAALLKDDGKMTNFLIEHGADESALDNKQKTAAYYKTRNSELDSKLLNVVPECPRSAKESFAANFDWSMLTSSLPLNGVKEIIRKASKLIENNNEKETEEVKENSNEEKHEEKEESSADKEEEHEETEENNTTGNDDVVEHSEEKQEKRSNGLDDENHITSHVNEESNEEKPTKTEPDEEVTGEEHSQEALKTEEEDDKSNDSNDGKKEKYNGEEGDLKTDTDDNEAEEEYEGQNKYNESNESENEAKEEYEDQNKNNESYQSEKPPANEDNNDEKPEEPEPVKSRPPSGGNSNTRPNSQTGNQSRPISRNSQTGNQSRPISRTQETSRPISNIDSNARPHTRALSRGINRSPVQKTPEPVVDGEGIIEGVVNGEDEIETLNNEGQNQRNTSSLESAEEVKAMVDEGNMEQLAALVLNGEGEKLVGQSSTNPELQSFLENVPVYMSKINRIHEAARNGSLRDLQAALDRRKFAIAKDPISPKGASPLHVAVAFGNTSIVRYLAGRFPETVEVTDEDGRTPLHYAAVLSDNGHYYNLLVHLGADARTKDKFGHTPEYYRRNQEEFSHRSLLREFGAEDQVADEILSDKVPGDTFSARKDLDDEDMLAVLERCYNVLHGRRNSTVSTSSTATTASRSGCSSVLNKHVRRHVFDTVKSRLTKMDHNLYDIIWPSVKKLPTDASFRVALEQDFPLGIVAPDFYVYKVFKELLEPIIKDYNAIDLHHKLQVHPESKFVEIRSGDKNKTVDVEMDLDPHLKWILSDNLTPENGQVDMPFFATEEGRYLASSLGDPLIKGLTEVANKRPEDPIAYLAQYLYNFANTGNTVRSRGRTQENQQIVTGSPVQVNDNNAVPASIDVVTVEPDDNPDDDSAFTNTSRDEHGQSMLHFAAARAHGRNALFQLLLETEMNVAYRDELYRTARDISIQANIPENTEEIDRYVLHIATKGDTDKLVELLLDGYDHITDIVDEEKVPIIEAVSAANQTDTVSFLQSILAFEEKRERVHYAIRQGSINDVTTLLADENDTGSGKLLAIGKNNYGRCTLHIAVLCQQEEIVDYLANTFPDTLKLGDNLERTALHYAMGVDKMESISRLLIKAGARRVTKDLKGRQPTYYFLNKSEILRLQEEEETF